MAEPDNFDVAVAQEDEHIQVHDAEPIMKHGTLGFGLSMLQLLLLKDH